MAVRQERENEEQKRRESKRGERGHTTRKRNRKIVKESEDDGEERGVEGRAKVDRSHGSPSCSRSSSLKQKV